VAGLDAGADDYVTKPFDREELRARVSTGQRIVELEERLADRVQELERALKEVKALSGLLPICAYCKRIREGEDYWQAVENYIEHHSDAHFSHGVCPDCYERIVKPELEKL
jgi:response regulator RpfG family c-di-GMP phosphodiesterase